jgi:ribosomal protein S12 methylthiotransferase
MGFPGETDADVEELEEFILEGHFSNVGVFTYSQEKEAVSYLFEGQIEEQLKQERRDRIMKAQQLVVKKELESKIGTREIVLVDGLHEESDLLLAARAQWQAPETDGMVIINELPDDQPLDVKGQFVEVEYVESAGYDMIARIVI